MQGCRKWYIPTGSKAQGWSVYLKNGEQVRYIETMNKNMLEEIERRKNGIESEYPKIQDPTKFIQQVTDEHMEQYHPAWSCVYYSDDKDILFIDLHY